MTKLKNRFHTQHSGTYNDYVHKRQTHQPEYELIDGKLTIIGWTDIQAERNLFLEDVNYKTAFEINDRGELKNKNYQGVPNPQYGDVADMPKDIVAVKELGQARLLSIQEQLADAVGYTSRDLEKIGKYNKKIAKVAKEKEKTANE